MSGGTPAPIWARLEELFHRAAEASAPERARLLAAAEAEHPELARRLRALLAANAAAPSEFLTPAPAAVDPAGSIGPIGSGGPGETGALVAAGDASPPGEVDPDLALIGERVGSFVVERLLGRGGMGVVYEASQERPRRAVALKLLRAHLVGPAALRRFELEAQTLARLQHPGIAQVYEVGRHGAGPWTRPYFAMELVRDSRTLIDHARAEGLDVRGRLGLFTELCAAVEHGHRRGIVHRDLKPANVLVTSEGQVKVIDFGLARSTDADVTLTTAHTDVGEIVGTLRYMSPEQCSGDPDDIDTRSDVYSLGIVLYELLSGEAPYDLSRKNLPEAVRTVLEAPPRRLGAVAPSLRSDLETIVHKALEKQRERRYPGATDLRRDLEHFLRYEPIEARPASRAYRLRMLARRNRLACATGVGLVAVLLLGIATTAQGWRRALQARDRAAAEAGTSAAVNEFLLDMVSAPDPARPSTEGAAARDVRVADVLAWSAGRIGERFAELPEVEARVRAAFARTYSALGMPHEALAQGARALDLRRALRPDPDPLATLELGLLVGSLLSRTGHHAEGQDELEASLAAARELSGPDDPTALLALNELAMHYRRFSRLVEARRVLDDVVARSTRTLGRAHPETVRALNTLGVLLRDLGEPAEARLLLEEAHALGLATDGPAHPDTLARRINLGLIDTDEGRLDEAAEGLRATLADCERILGPEHPVTLFAVHAHGALHHRRQEHEAAEGLYRRVYEVRHRVLGPENRDTLEAGANLATVWFDLERGEDGLALLDELLPLARACLPPESVLPHLLRGNQGLAFYELGRLEEAELALEEAHAGLRELPGTAGEHARTLGAWLARLYEQTGRPAEAARLREAERRP